MKISELQSFVDLPGMPEVYRDTRQVITEKVTWYDGGRVYRQTRVVITGPGVVLGNHRHTFREDFRGRGGGKVILIPPGCVIPPQHLGVFTYELPKGPWKLTVEPGVAHAFIFDGEPDGNGEIAVVISESYAVEDYSGDTANTFRDVLVQPS